MLASSGKGAAGADRRPEVIVDFLVEEGMLFVVLANVGVSSARDISTRFDHGFRGLGGQREIGALRAFQHLDFLAPGKRLEQFVDPISTYAARGEPLVITASVAYRDRDGREYQDRIVHDLRAYLELGSVDTRPV